MARLTLPPQVTDVAPSMRDVNGAKAWLGAQSGGQALRLARALLPELRALDGSDLAAQTRFDILETLRPALIEAEEGIEARYARKPLPMLEEEAAVFQTAWQLWHALAVAYLRIAPLLAAPQMLPAMHRAAIALREALHCHYAAGVEADSTLLPLLYELIVSAESMHMQRTPVTDPHWPHLGESTVAGDAAWAMMLHFCDPYRFTAAQFVVANRALSRWRDLATFQPFPDDDPKAKAIPLDAWLPAETFAAGGPRWLDIKLVIRKLRKRLEAIESGESAEQLKLGRDLSGPAAARLLRELDKQLRPHPREIGDALDGAAIDLIHGHARLYTMLTGRAIHIAELRATSSSISHERMALFGFDNAATRVDMAKSVDIPVEKWAIEDRWVLRPAPAGEQVLVPALVGIPSTSGTPPRLAILYGLRLTADGWLAAHLRLLPPVTGTGLHTLPSGLAGQPGQRLPAFFLAADDSRGEPPSVCLPTGSGLREGSPVALEESAVDHLRLREAIERGGHFTRFAYTRV